MFVFHFVDELIVLPRDVPAVSFKGHLRMLFDALRQSVHIQIELPMQTVTIRIEFHSRHDKAVRLHGTAAINGNVVRCRMRRIFEIAQHQVQRLIDDKPRCARTLTVDEGDDGSLERTAFFGIRKQNHADRRYG